MKKIVAMFLTACISLCICIPAFAMEQTGSSSDVQVLTDNIVRGTGYPSGTWDLSKNDYKGVFDFGSTIYTNYYFNPNSNGQLNVWLSSESTNGNKALLAIHCLEKTTFAYKNVGTIYTDTSVYPFASGTFTGLDTSKKYFLEISVLYNDGSYNIVGDIEVSH